VDVRIVAATNRDLQAEAAAGRFRSDLFYRLNVVEIALPPLRDRVEDIPYLTAAFIREFGSKFRKSIDGISSGAERALLAQPWLGNVRELRNVLERACMLSEGQTLTERDLLAAMPQREMAKSGPPPASRGESARTLTEDLDGVEREHIVRVLSETRGNKRAAADRLGVSRRTLYRKLERHNLLADRE
jgi:two-component system response regulator HydG